jgi:hypothetical protein
MCNLYSITTNHTAEPRLLTAFADALDLLVYDLIFRPDRSIALHWWSLRNRSIDAPAGGPARSIRCRARGGRLTGTRASVAGRTGGVRRPKTVCPDSSGRLCGVTRATRIIARIVKPADACRAVGDAANTGRPCSSRAGVGRSYSASCARRRTTGGAASRRTTRSASPATGRSSCPATSSTALSNRSRGS